MEKSKSTKTLHEAATKKQEPKVFLKNRLSRNSNHIQSAKGARFSVKNIPNLASAKPELASTR